MWSRSERVHEGKRGCMRDAAQVGRGCERVHKRHGMGWRRSESVRATKRLRRVHESAWIRKHSQECMNGWCGTSTVGCRGVHR